MFPNIKEISEIDNVWSKAKNLAILSNNWYKIPEWFVVHNDFISNHINFWEQLDISKNLELLWSRLNAVRSSSSIEDWFDLSFAWAFDSYLNVAQSDVTNKVVDCYNSLYWEKIISILWNKSLDLKMSVIIQEMILWQLSWVAFSKNPVNNDSSEIVIESVKWICDNLVSWKITPNRFNFPKNINFSSLNEYKNLFKSVLDIEQFFWYPVDIEWTIRDGILYILQVRPITSNINNQNQSFNIENNENKLILEWIPANNWTVKWKVVFIKDIYEDISKVDSNSIIIAEETTPLLYPAMIISAWIITSKWWILSHAAITSRELNKPCIVWVNNLFENIKEGDNVFLNATEWKIYKIN